MQYRWCPSVLPAPILQHRLLGSYPSILSQEGCLSTRACCQACLGLDHLTGDKCPERGHQHSWAPDTEVNWPDRKEVLPRPSREGVPVPWSVASGLGAAGGRGLEEGQSWPTQRPQGVWQLPGTRLPFQPQSKPGPSQLLAFQWGEAQR